MWFLPISWVRGDRACSEAIWCQWEDVQYVGHSGFDQANRAFHFEVSDFSPAQGINDQSLFPCVGGLRACVKRVGILMGRCAYHNCHSWAPLQSRQGSKGVMAPEQPAFPWSGWYVQVMAKALQLALLLSVAYFALWEKRLQTSQLLIRLLSLVQLSLVLLWW